MGRFKPVEFSPEMMLFAKEGGFMSEISLSESSPATPTPVRPPLPAKPEPDEQKEPIASPPPDSREARLDS